MKKMHSLIASLLFALCAVVVTTGSALAAYIDPAAGSYLIQVLVGVGVAIAATVAVFWRKITFWFKKQKAMRMAKKKQKKN